MTKVLNYLLVLVIILSVLSLFLEQADFTDPVALLILEIIDFAVFIFTLLEAVFSLLKAKNSSAYLRRNWLSHTILVLYVLVFLVTKAFLLFPLKAPQGSAFPKVIIILRNLLLIRKVSSRLKRFAALIESITIHPAQTIVLSFLLVILVGTLALMMPFTTLNGKGLPFLDSLFTATSAVCVTGLIVVDTATVFTLPGQIIIILLIQVGGLGIMLISYFTLFSLRRAVSVEEKLLISYMLSQEDMSQLSGTIRRIIRTTFIIEGFGALILFLGFSAELGFSMRSLFYGIFHSISAFCNAGFALFSDSLEGFVSSPIISLTISALIILGGISFAVIINLWEILRGRTRKLSFNSKIVLITTAVLLGAGTLLIYGLEHPYTLREHSLGTQYLAAFFQSVTLRTAGFNTLPFSSLFRATPAVMILFMFVGAAPGSTAGGIKVSTLGVLWAYVLSVLKKRPTVTLMKHGIGQNQVMNAFQIFLFGILAVSLGSLLLSITEEASYEILLFEAVSAFATVGLSLGITGLLSGAGKTVIIVLMFAGRLGPLTIFAAAAKEEGRVRIEYPLGDISLG